MGRESAKRTAVARGDRQSARTASPKSRRTRGKVNAPEINPESDRAPGRGKYDRSRSADQRHKQQLSRLLDAAGHVFAEMGWADATVEAIVNRAGMSRRTFYEHFDDLRDCLQAFHQRATRRAFRAVEVVVENADTKPGERLRMGIMGFLGGIGMFPEVARVIFRVVRSAGPEFEAAHEQMIGRFAKLVHDGLAEAYARGRFELPPDELRVFGLVSAMEAI